MGSETKENSKAAVNTTTVLGVQKSNEAKTEVKNTAVKAGDKIHAAGTGTVNTGATVVHAVKPAVKVNTQVKAATGIIIH